MGVFIASERGWALELFCLLAACGGAVRFLGGGAPEEAVPATKGGSAPAHKKAAFQRFQREYLTVYLVIMFADWLQGTNMWTLYTGYGVSFSTLFLTGFLSSFVFGTFLGMLVDRYGRRNACVAFCVLEVVINLLEHIPDMRVLLVGRVLGGISTSLLFSAFESWMVSEHRRRGFDENLLASTFSLSAAGNGVAAVAAGFVAQYASDLRGDLGPFQVAIALTVVALGLVMRWPENYGDETAEGGVAEAVATSFRSAAKAVFADRRLALLALVTALFEGATFTFVAMWVPTLMRLYGGAGGLPTGLVFACFMVAVTIGGEAFGALAGSSDAKFSVEHVALGVLGVASVSMLVAALSSSFAVVLTSFLALEACVGAFNGCAATMRSRYIPDAVQSAVMNLSRVPLNALVVAGTTVADAAPPKIAFLTVAAMLGAGAFFQLRLIHAAAAAPSKKAD
ncbi:hypothetical protein M885DRAFT_622331 [Pelagophyceae sp. CCMP2097]|nr:hypothetical protein M885DRAFT_622331 [Pelagophyceae sp. CCMP2097]